MFSPEKDPVTIPYNNDLVDLEMECPDKMFQNDNFSIEKRSELFEMQFNYIFMNEIQGNSKIDFSRALKDCQDIQVFEQESI
jgi:hypothetical protein